MVAGAPLAIASGIASRTRRTRSSRSAPTCAAYSGCRLTLASTAVANANPSTRPPFHCGNCARRLLERENTISNAMIVGIELISNSPICLSIASMQNIL